MEVVSENNPADDKQKYTEHVCKPCEKVFNGKDKLKAHNYVAHRYVVQMCDICSNEFKNSIALKGHVRRVHVSEAVKCKDCDKEFKSNILLKAHMKRYHEKSKDCICNLCQKRYKNKYCLDRHVWKYHSLKRPWTRFNKNHIVEGKLDDSLEGQYCKECDKTYTTKSAFNRHQTNSHKWQPAICQICPYGSQNIQRLRSHYTIKHQVARDEARLLVPTPDGTFDEEGVKRIRTFKGKRKTCVHCGKTYDHSTFSKHRKKCHGYLPAGVERAAEVDPATIKDILERALATPRQESSQGKEQRRKRENKVELWKKLQNKGKLEEIENKTQTNSDLEIQSTPETITKSEATESSAKADAGAQSLNSFQAEEEELAEKPNLASLEDATEIVKNAIEMQSLNNLFQSKEELAEQLGLSNLVTSNLTRDEMLESLHEAILSEPGNYETNNAETDLETPYNGIESEVGIDQLEPTNLDLVNKIKGSSNENGQMQKIAVKAEKSDTDIYKYVEESSATENKENHKQKFTCNHCQVDYKKEANLKKHIKRQHGMPNEGNTSTNLDKKYYSCNHCNEGFSAKRELMRHQAKKHKNNDGERKYICDICSKRYKRQGGLDNHLQVDHGIDKETSLQKLCSLCSKSFRGMHSLKGHIRRIHGNQENFICSDCGKYFKDKAYLKNHVTNVHIVTNEQCEKCSKICKNKPALEKHMKHNHC